MTSACSKAVGQNHAIFGGDAIILVVDKDHDVVEVADSLDHLAEDYHVHIDKNVNPILISVLILRQYQ